ncbi:MAG: hypothetical protein KC502_23260, partial [Myxococcales bacterium]|nr:hypothetical protein [Myxococcales bacterium]
ADTAQDAAAKDVTKATIASVGLAMTYGGEFSEEFSGIASWPSGAMIAAGYTQGYGAVGEDGFAVSVSSDGKPVWAGVFGGKGKERFHGAAARSDGGAWLAGETDSFGSQTEAWLVRVDSKGKVAASIAYGGEFYDRAVGVDGLPDGAVMVCKTYSYGPGTPKRHNAMVIRTDDNGKTLWSSVIGGEKGGDAGFGIVALPKNAGFAMGGAVESWGAGDDDIWLLRLDSKGKLMWSFAYGTGADDEGRTVAASNDGGFVVSGFTEGWGAQDADAFVLKVDSKGTVKWLTRLGGAAEDKATAVKSLGADTLMAGQTKSWGTGTDAWLVRLDDKGTIKKAHTLGGTKSEKVAGLTPLKDGAWVGAGYTRSHGGGGRDSWIVRSNSAGQPVCAAHDVVTSDVKVSQPKVTGAPIITKAVGGVKSHAAAVKATLVTAKAGADDMCAGGN